MNILLLLAHSIAEYDDVRMFTDMGHDVFSVGAYTDPRHPGDDKRPALPQAPWHPELAALVPDQMAAKEHLPPELLEWADAVIVHHYLDRWVADQWGRLRPGPRRPRIIWRTCGQSDFRLEERMAPLVREGLEVVRYSPAERRFFEPSGRWAGQQALIRFGKYLADYPAWEPDREHPYVANVTQNMLQRGDWCGLGWYSQATRGLDARPAGPGSEELPGGVGMLEYPDLLEYLRRASAYVYTGTVPASYTLGLLEAMLVGVPIVSMTGEAWMGPSQLWEGDELAGWSASQAPEARAMLAHLLEGELPGTRGVLQGERAREFLVQDIALQWDELLLGRHRCACPDRQRGQLHAAECTYSGLGLRAVFGGQN